MKYFLTTAIDFVNSRPHLGTAYEKVTADIIARYRSGGRLRFAGHVDIVEHAAGDNLAADQPLDEGPHGRQVGVAGAGLPLRVLFAPAFDGAGAELVEGSRTE